ncbi:hypothetical protein V1506DRAFT_509192 [Lipomyces tetrasporus]
MARRSKKSIQRSINGRKNVMKRFGKVNQVTRHDGEGCGGHHREELQLPEILLNQSEIETVLRRLRFRSEADKLLKYATRPGGSERSIRRFKAKYRNVESMKPLTAFNFTNTASANVNLSEENRKQKERESEPRGTEEDLAPETPLDVHGLLQRIEIRLQNKQKMPEDEALQLTVLKRYFIDQLRGEGENATL